MKVSNKKGKARKSVKESKISGDGKDILKGIEKAVKSGKIKYGTKLIFTGEKGAATGAGDIKDMKFYFITFGKTFAAPSIRLSKAKPQSLAELFDAMLPTARLPAMSTSISKTVAPRLGLSIESGR